MTGTSAAVQATCRRPAYRPYRTAGRKAEYGRFSVLPRPEIYRNLRIKDSVKIDPACGTFGFMIVAHQYVKDQTDDFFDLDADTAKFEREQAFTGCELVHDTHRLALMNAMLHDIEGQILFLNWVVEKYFPEFAG